MAPLWPGLASAGHENTKEGYAWEPSVTHLVSVPFDGLHFNNWQCIRSSGCFWDRGFEYGEYYGKSCDIAGGTRTTLGDCGHRTQPGFRFLTGACSGQPGCSSGVSQSLFGGTAVIIEGAGTWHYDVWPNPTSFAVRVCTEWGISGGVVDAAGHRVVNGVAQTTVPLCGRWAPVEVEDEPEPEREPCPPGQTRVEGVCKVWCTYTGAYLLPSQRCNRPSTSVGRGLCYGITAPEIFDEAVDQNKAPEFWVTDRRFFPRIWPSSITAEVDEEVWGSVYRPSDYGTSVVFDGLGDNGNRRANCGSLRARLVGLRWEFRGGGDPTVVKGGREITDFGNYQCTRGGGWGDCTGSLKFRFGTRTAARFVVTAYWETRVRPRSSTGEPAETFLSDTSASITVAAGPPCTPAPPPESAPLVAARLSWKTRLAASSDYEATGDEPWQLPLSHPGAESYVLTAGGEMWPVLVGDSLSLDVADAGTGCSWRMDKVVIGFRELHPWVSADTALIDQLDPGPSGLTARWRKLSRSNQDWVRRWAALNGQPAPLECRRSALHGSNAAPERHCRWTLPRVGIWRWTMDVHYRLEGQAASGVLRVGEGTEWFVSPADHAAQRLTFAY